MPDQDPSVIDAAQQWTQRCLLDELSVFTDEHLWTAARFRDLHHAFVDRLEVGEGDFFQRLETQLQAGAPETRKLVAEMLWVMVLTVDSAAMRATTKRDQVQRVWAWSGDELPRDHDLLGTVLEHGSLHPGVAYTTQRWRELAFFCLAMESWLSLGRSRRERLLADREAFLGWIDEQDGAARRRLRHVLVALLFPEQGEPSAEFDADPGTDEELTEQAEAWFRDTFGEVSVWVYSPGPRGRDWADCVRDGIAVVGWDEVGDLQRFDHQDDIYTTLIDLYAARNPTNDTLALWQFSHELREGDVLVAKSGRKFLLGYGVVQGPYRFAPERAEHRHVVPVDWMTSTPIELDAGHGLPIKTLTRADEFRGYVARLMVQLREADASSPASAVDVADGAGAEDAVGSRYSLDDAMSGLFLPRATFEGILQSLERRKNVILQGPPGVGKTYIGHRVAWALLGRRKLANVERVQFHQSYSYEDFVQGWRPTEGGGFTLRNGIFHAFCERARQHSEENFVFIIDEINRGNLSRIFGELLMLIEADKRGPEYAIPLTYSDPDERFSVPENVHLLGMMNTADRSLALVDYALRRRFAFVQLPPAFGTQAFRTHLLDAGTEPDLVDRLDRAMRRLNAKIAADTRNLGPGFEIGHSYFVPGDDDDALDTDWYREIVRTQIEPLLREYFFDQASLADEFLAELDT